MHCCSHEDGDELVTWDEEIERKVLVNFDQWV